MQISEEQLKEIQEIYRYKSAIRALRRDGLQSILFAGIVFLPLLLEPGKTIESPVQVILASLVIMMGLWCILFPSVTGIFINGISKLITAVWVIYSWLSSDIPTKNESFGDVFMQNLMAGLGMIISGIRSLWLHNELSQKYSVEPAEDVVKSVEELAKTIKDLDPGKHKNCVEFQYKPFIGNQAKIKGVLLSNSVLFFSSDDRILYDRKENIDVKVGKKLFLQDRYKATLKIGNKKYSGFISMQSLLKLKAGTVRMDMAISLPENTKETTSR
jgi:hypothetical protein